MAQRFFMRVIMTYAAVMAEAAAETVRDLAAVEEQQRVFPSSTLAGRGTTGQSGAPDRTEDRRELISTGLTFPITLAAEAVTALLF